MTWSWHLSPITAVRQSVEVVVLDVDVFVMVVDVEVVVDVVAVADVEVVVLTVVVVVTVVVVMVVVVVVVVDFIHGNCDCAPRTVCKAAPTAPSNEPNHPLLLSPLIGSLTSSFSMKTLVSLDLSSRDMTLRICERPLLRILGTPYQHATNKPRAPQANARRRR